MKRRKRRYRINNSIERRVRVVIIDSGIDAGILGLYVNDKASTAFRINEEGYITEVKDLKACHIHGTVIALLIRHICKNVEFISINILNERLVSDARVLLCAFKRAVEIKPDIVHLSLGTTKWKYRFALNTIVRHARKNNIIVVAAANNEGKKSYPAYLRGVIGVKARVMKDNNPFDYQDGFFYAPLDTKGIEEFETLGVSDYATGSSVAAAYMTGYIASLISSRKKIVYCSEIIGLLKSSDFKDRGI
ncbi:MAG: S8 family serine peptidase [Clostridia bacterium]|nr:S8 family serine peptidase [Clostridia bacterium]